MKLRFDFTKTDNTVMQSNVVDIPTGGTTVGRTTGIQLLNLNDSKVLVILGTSFNLEFGATNAVNDACQAIIVTEQVGSSTYAYVSYVKNSDKLTYYFIAPPGNACTIRSQNISTIIYAQIT